MDDIEYTQMVGKDNHFSSVPGPESSNDLQHPVHPRRWPIGSHFVSESFSLFCRFASIGALTISAVFDTVAIAYPHLHVFDLGSR